MNPEATDTEQQNSGVNWKETLVDDRWRILGVLLIALAVVLLAGWEIKIPRWLRLFGITVAISALIGYPAAARIVAWLYRPSWTYLVDVDARTDEFAVWKLPPDVWRELQVENGELYQLRSASPAWGCQNYDPEANVAEGTWRGSASDLELIEDRERIDEIRGVLEDLAKEGLTIRVKQSGIVRTAVRGIVMSFVEGFENETLYDGEQIEQSVENALGRWDMDDDESIETPEPGDDGSITEENVGVPQDGPTPEATDD